ncbi:MAG: TPM domain-containing protein, partial [Bacteroidales bacterium]|nr:TPM domain-containing protein [Bacteroidales bacterium]
MKKIILLFFLISSINLFSQWTPNSVPDPKTIDGGYVSNPDNILSASTVDSLNRMIKAADDSGFVQIAVVALNSIGDDVPKEFASELFNLWGIGQKGADNGLLVLLVVDQHRVEFETGYGLETILTDAECYTIQQNYMIDYFKIGDYDAGVISGIEAVINETSTNSFLQDYSTDVDNGYDYDNYSNNYTFLDYLLYSKFGKIYIGIGSFLLIAFIIILFITLFIPDRYHRYQALRIFSNPVIFVIFPLPFAFLLILVNFLLKRWRNTPRISLSGKIMHKLDEKDDNKFLSGGQITEEKIKSIDYDVWITDDHQETLILAYKRWFSKYSQCPKCKFKTYFLKSDRVITAATYSSSGVGEKTYKCEHCGHSVTRQYTIPQKQKSSST